MKKKLLDFKNAENYFRYLTELFELQINQFEYQNMPDTLPPEFLEMYILVNGTCAIGNVKGDPEIYCAIGSYNGDYNGYLPDSYTAAVIGKDEISGKWYGKDKTIVVAKNNNMGMPEYDIPFTADVLNQIDVSEKMNVIFTRFSRIPFAENDKEKAQIESAIKSIIRGDYTAIASRDFADSFEEYIEGAKEKEKFLDLVDVDKVNGLQYLNQYRDNVFKRFLCRRGYMVQTTSKLAQQTNAEMHGADSYAFLYPIQQLKQRQKMCEEINTLFGLETSVDFNPILKKVYERYMTDPEPETKENVSRETNDDEPDPAETEPADESKDGENNDENN